MIERLRQAIDALEDVQLLAPEDRSSLLYLVGELQYGWLKGETGGTLAGAATSAVAQRLRVKQAL